MAGSGGTISLAFFCLGFVVLCIYLLTKSTTPTPPSGTPKKPATSAGTATGTGPAPSGTAKKPATSTTTGGSTTTTAIGSNQSKDVNAPTTTPNIQTGPTGPTALGALALGAGALNLGQRAIQGSAAAGANVGMTVGGEVASKASEKLGEKVSKRAINKAGTKAGSKIGQKLAGLGARVGIKAGEKAGVRAGAKLAATAAVAASTGPGAPFVEVAELAFSAFTGYLDSFNLGGFQNLKHKDVLDATRDQVNKQYEEAFKEANIELPIIVGPLDLISSNDSNLLMINEVTRLGGGTDDNTLNRAFENVCAAKGGVMVTHPKTGVRMCTWTDPNKCIPKFPLGTSPDDSLYYEFDKTNNFCVQKPSIMKTTCEGLGYDVTYNPDTGSCNLTDKYCRRYGEDDGLRNGDCAESKGEAIASLIFGTAFVHGIVNVFGSDNYAPCNPGDHNTAYGHPKLGNFFCAGNHCPNGQENIGGICYQECRRSNDPGGGGYGAKPGIAGKNYVSYGDENKLKVSTCYEECPAGYNSTVGFCTRLPETKMDTGVASRCPPDYPHDNGAGLCYKNCQDGYFEYLGACYKNGVDKNNLTQQPRQTCPKGDNIYFRGLDCEECNKDGRDRKVAGSCRHGRSIYAGRIIQTTKICPDGYELTGPLSCQAIRKEKATPKSKIEVGVCDDDKDRINGLCYKKCDTANSFHRTSPGMCQKDSLSLVRDQYVRQPKNISSVFYAKKRITPLATTTQKDFEASPLGHQMNKFAQGVTSGNMESVGQGLVGMAATGNAMTNALGLGQDFGDLMQNWEEG